MTDPLRRKSHEGRDADAGPGLPSGRVADKSCQGEAGRFVRGTLDALDLCVAILDEPGTILAANRSWRELALSGSGLGGASIGDNCLAVCAGAAAAGNTVAGEISAGFRAVIDGTLPDFTLRYIRCTSREDRWFDLRVSAVEDDTERRILVTLDDATERHRTLDILLESAARHRHAESIAKLGHWRLVLKSNDWKDGAIEYSEQTATILGLEPGSNAHSLEAFKKIIHPDDLDAVLAAYAAVDSDSYMIEYRIIRPDGSVVTVQEAGESVYDAEGRVVFDFGTIQDITEERRDSDRLRQLNDELERMVLERTAAVAERESQLKRAQALAQIGHYTWHKAHETQGSGAWNTGLNYSPAAAAIFGVAPAELVLDDDDYVARFVHPDDQTFVLGSYRTTFQERLRKGLPLEYRLEYRIVRADRTIRHVVEIIERKAGAGNDVIEALGMIQDITERKQAELALRDSEARLQAFMNYAPFIMSIKGTDGRLLMINREGAESYGSPVEAILGHRTDELIANIGGQSIAAMSREVLATGAAVTREVEFPDKSRYRWSLEMEFPILDVNGHIATIGGFAVDITEQKQAELALRESEARLRAIFDHAPVILSLRDPAGHYTMVNGRFLDTFGRNENHVIGRTALDLYGPEMAPIIVGHIEKVVRELKPNVHEEHLLTAAGERDFLATQFPIIDSSGTLTAIGAISLDMTQQRAAEAALYQAQKMEAVGQLTGGFAHDFNNLLGAIVGNLDLLALEIGERPRERVLLQRTIVAAERGTALIQRLLAFSRRQTLSPRLTDINELVLGMRPLLEQSLGGASSVTIRTSAKCPNSLVDPAQLESALLNLAINARDAMPMGGVLDIDTADVVVYADKSQMGRSLQIGHYVMIAISDNGAGMAPEVILHAFEPFFTTKAIGKGTGLGLSMVHGFVKQSGGYVRIDSELGKGTRVTVFLPCAATQTETRAAAGDAVSCKPLGLGELILVIDADPLVRAELLSTLHQNGYRCIEASDAREALRRLAEHEDVALLFTDLVLPGGMNGFDLVKSARLERPKLKALYATDLVDGGVRSSSDPTQGDGVGSGPCRIDRVNKIVADILTEQ